MDVVSIWKAVSIALTGAFGILGLLTDFRDEDTDRLTRWGKVSLTGILLSTVLGVAFQLKESSDAQESQAKTSSQTLAIVQATQTTVTDVGRLLTPLSEPQVSVVMSASCRTGRFVKYCDVLKGMEAKVKTVNGRRALPSLHPKSELLAIELCFYKSRPTPQQVADCRYAYAGDLRYAALGVNDDRDRSLVLRLSRDREMLEIAVYGDGQFGTVSNGRLASTLDLPGSTLILLETSRGLEGLVPKVVHLRFGGGRVVEVDLTKMQRIEIAGQVAYSVEL